VTSWLGYRRSETEDLCGIVLFINHLKKHLYFRRGTGYSEPQSLTLVMKLRQKLFRSRHGREEGSVRKAYGRQNVHPQFKLKSVA
jgi:hypothetical protein